MEGGGDEVNEKKKGGDEAKIKTMLCKETWKTKMQGSVENVCYERGDKTSCNRNRNGSRCYAKRTVKGNHG
jgi:hypothetical protein